MGFRKIKTAKKGQGAYYGTKRVSNLKTSNGQKREQAIMSTGAKLRHIRRQMWERKYNCFVCGAEIINFEETSLEHVVPRSLGGKSGMRNLWISHLSCNFFRGNTRCRLVWENRKITLQLGNIKSGSEMIDAWLEKYGLTRIDLKRLMQKPGDNEVESLPI